MVRVLWGLVGVIVALLVVKFFVADVYRIQSGSMRPTIFGGAAPNGGEALTDRVLVRYGNTDDLRRFDLVVLRPRGSSESSAPVVKRVVGLPGETIQVVDGDLLIDGRRLDRDARRPEPVVVFDDRSLDVEDFFLFKADGPWRREGPRGDEWFLDAAAIPRRRSDGMMLYSPDLNDDFMDPLGGRVAGLRQVNDAILECEFALVDHAPSPGDGATLRFLLVEEGDTFEVDLAPDPRRTEEEGADAYVVNLLHRNVRSLLEADPRDRERLFASQRVAIEVGKWYRLHFANVDNRLTVELPELGVVLRHSYESNEPFPGEPSAGDRSRGHRVGLGGDGGRARFRSIRVLRDLFYTAVGEHGVGEPLSLGPDQVFVLGDCSADSEDSRHFGPVGLSELVGRPVAIVWPPSRWKRL